MLHGGLEGRRQRRDDRRRGRESTVVKEWSFLPHRLLFGSEARSHAQVHAQEAPRRAGIYIGVSDRAALGLAASQLHLQALVEDIHFYWY